MIIVFEERFQEYLTMHMAVIRLVMRVRDTCGSRGSEFDDRNAVWWHERLRILAESAIVTLIGVCGKNCMGLASNYIRHGLTSCSRLPSELGDYSCGVMAFAYKRTLKKVLA